MLLILYIQIVRKESCTRQNEGEFPIGGGVGYSSKSKPLAKYYYRVNGILTPGFFSRGLRFHPFPLPHSPSPFSFPHFLSPFHLPHPQIPFLIPPPLSSSSFPPNSPFPNSPPSFPLTVSPSLFRLPFPLPHFPFLIFPPFYPSSIPNLLSPSSFPSPFSIPHYHSVLFLIPLSFPSSSPFPFQITLPLSCSSFFLSSPPHFSSPFPCIIHGMRSAVNIIIHKRILNCACTLSIINLNSTTVSHEILNFQRTPSLNCI